MQMASAQHQGDWFPPNYGNRWAVMLAGGDGKRLLSVTRKLTGDDTPKQFCSLDGQQTLLGRTRQRISRTVAEEQTLILLTRTHQRFYSRQLPEVPRRRL